MKELIYTEVEYRKDKDGFDEKWVYVPALDEWMTENEFYYQKSCYDGAMGDAQAYWDNHSNDEVYNDDFDDEYDNNNYEEDEYEEIDYSKMSREEALEEYNRTGVNHSEYDLNDWDDIKSRLGYDLSELLKGIK